MKKNSILWAVLPMMAAALMTTACSKDDNVNESPAQQSTVKTIPYSVTVNDGATTRATVDSDNKTLKFAAGDKLYITGTNIKGVLDIQSGTGTASATFSGDLTYSGEGSPAADLELTATLVSAQQTDGSEVTINSTTNAVTVNYPTTAYCADVATAVQKYSNLTGTSTYSAKSFSLAQQTAFLNFEITFEDGTATGTSLSAVVNNNSSNICTANVTTTTESTKVVAKFVLPVAKGTTLSSAKVTMGSKAAISFGASQTLDGKVYNVKKSQAASTRTLSSATMADYGMVVCAAGHLHTAKTAVPSGCTAVGILGKVTSTGHGLILALQDATSQTWNTINGWTSETTYASTALKLLPDNTARGANLTSYTTLGSTTVSNWAVAQKSDYEAIFANLGSTTGDKDGYTFDANVNAYITTGVGGTAISGGHWSATATNAWSFRNDYWHTTTEKTTSLSVRPVLAF
ncbi:MAG: hypothetical protein LIR31_03640 [Bacteroidota bacterium]|nr:hypothetical protein [Bacteroidota bacterium]